MKKFEDRNIPSQTPTSQNPIVVDRITVYPDMFIHKDQQYSFDSIQHIYFNWTVHSVNDTPDSEAMLLILILEPPHPEIHTAARGGVLKRFSIQKYKLTPQIQHLYNAYKYISEKTFHSRLHGYIATLESEKKFKYIHYKNPKGKKKEYVYFHSNGLVEIGKKSFNVHDVKVRRFPYNLTFKITKGLFGKMVVINIGVDNDVFTYLFSKLYGI